MNKKIYWIAVILSFILLTTCKKYENGPLISLKSPEKRLLGKWEIEEVKKDGSIVTDFDSLEIDYYHFEIVDGYSAQYDANVLGRVGNNITNSGLILWGFRENETELNFSNTDLGTPSYLYPLPTMIANSERWKIKKLSSNRMWLEIDVAQGFIEVKLKKQK